jgi:hypothetical protein
MAVAVTLEFKGTLDQYDDVIAKMGFSPGGAGAPGSISHMVVATDDGIRVTDVWESREQFEAFGRDQIGPLTQQAGITEPPAVEFQDVHNYLTKG